MEGGKNLYYMTLCTGGMTGLCFSIFEERLLLHWISDMEKLMAETRENIEINPSCQ